MFAIFIRGRVLKVTVQTDVNDSDSCGGSNAKVQGSGFREWMDLKNKKKEKKKKQKEKVLKQIPVAEQQ